MVLTIVWRDNVHGRGARAEVQVCRLLVKESLNVSLSTAADAHLVRHRQKCVFFCTLVITDSEKHIKNIIWKFDTSNNVKRAGNYLI